jgi:hypothetical protein
MRKGKGYVVLTAPTGAELTLWAAGGAVLCEAVPKTTVIDEHMKALDVWTQELDGEDAAFEEAIAYLEDTA